jgi:phenylacetaldehyde dehydrogenase
VRWSIFLNAGQVCSGGSRLYVERAILGPVTKALIDLAGSMVLAPGLDPSCDMGPVISKDQQARILGYIERAKAQGVEVLAGGQAGADDGFFVQPTVLLAHDNAAEAVQEEIFGPVLTVVPFDDADQALSFANDNAYGLGASVWTRDISVAMRFGRRLHAGSVWVNAHDLVDSGMPFGGFKASGFGKDMGKEQIEACLRTKSLWIAS